MNHLPSLFVETLEPRIAPAILVNGGNLLGAKFGPTTGETSSGGNTVTLVKVLSGSALVFYDGSSNEITSISVGANTKLDVTGDVNDIVTNLAANGRLTDADGDPSNGEDGGILLPSNFKGVTTHALTGSSYGSIGRIIAGGSVKDVVTTSPQATVHGLYAGDGIFRNGPTAQVSVAPLDSAGAAASVDYNSIQSGVQDSFTLDQGNGQFKATASVSNATINIGAGLEVFAGSGANNPSGTGGFGGSIAGVHVFKSFAGNGSAAAIYLYAGDGGNGSNGGTGGSITSFTDDGSTTLVRVQTGHGGAGANGDGGFGGSFLTSTISTKSASYRFEIGSGGDGTHRGGDGGVMKGISFTSAILTAAQFDASGARSSGTLIASGDFNGDGAADSVVVNATNGNAVVSLAAGGTALTPVNQPDGSAFVGPQGLTPTDLVTADFNGDGALDYAVSYGSSNNIGVFLNDGTGHFTGSQIKLSSSPYRLATGDFSGSASADLAYLTLPASDAIGANLTSRVFEVQNNDAAGFAPKATPALVNGTASDFVAAPIDGDTHTDLFVSIDDAAGSVQSLVASNANSSAPFNRAATILTGVAHITHLDAVKLGATLHLLAFSVDTGGSTADAGTTPDAGATVADKTPALALLTINASGQYTSLQAGSIVSGAKVARFVGDAGDYGVLTNESIQVTSSDGVASRSYTAADGRISNFTPLGADASDAVLAVGPIPTRLFVSSGSSLVTSALPIAPQVYSFLGGDGGHGGTGAGGAGGKITTVTFAQTLDGGADASGGAYTVTLVGGNGGASDQSVGGAGGKITTVTFAQTLDGGADVSGGAYTVALVGGNGGASDQSVGGAGGNLNKMSISVDPANLTTVDDTTLLSMHAGSGGAGAIGGKGGSINSLTATALFDEIVNETVRLNAFAVDLEGGAGGIGNFGAGGAGGNVTLNGKASLTGVTFYDANSTVYSKPALIATGGDGGQGATLGGAGGAVTNVGSQNAPIGTTVLATNELSSALLTGGTGGAGLHGAGGIGGDVQTADISVQATAVPFDPATALFYGGALRATAGDGGNSSGGIGGAGGSVKSSTLASVQGDLTANVGVVVHGGDGGGGTSGGGKGGAISTLALNSPSDPTLYGSALFGGNGGAALGGGVGGNGGGVKGVTQTKDVNSTINVILGGAGGAGGGVGGSIEKINAVGFIGSPNSGERNPVTFTPDSSLQHRIGAYNPTIDAPEIASYFASGVVPQGIFAGRGEGGNGTVSKITARQISAIAASPDANGLFAPAASVSQINADLIGFDAAGGTDNVFDSASGTPVSPLSGVPLDGFILATVVSEINTVNNARTGAFTFLG